MALKKIDKAKHGLLLFKLGYTQYRGEEAKTLEKSLKLYYQRFHELLDALEKTAMLYDEVAAEIRTLRPGKMPNEIASEKKSVINM